MISNSINKAKKIINSLNIFLNKEEEIKNSSKNILNSVIKKSDNEKIKALKGKIQGQKYGR